jgi:hypothetical protein
MIGTTEKKRREGPTGELSQEALAFMTDMGICPGSTCPRAKDRCDPRCPALRAWLDEVVNG